MEDLQIMGCRSAGSRRWLSFVSMVVVVGVSLSGCAFKPFGKTGTTLADKESPAIATTRKPPASTAHDASVVQPGEAVADDETRDPAVPPPTSVAAADRSTARFENSPRSAASLASFNLPSAPTTPQVARADARPCPSNGTVIHGNQATFDREVLQSDVPVLVDFYAKWCIPCKALSPTLDKVASENRQAKVVKIDIDDSPQLAARYGVKSVPSLVVIKDGQVVAKERGIVSKSKLLAMLDK